MTTTRFSQKTIRPWRAGHCSGQALPEYALVIALITVVCVSALIFMGQHLKDGLLNFASQVSGIKTSS